MRAPRKVHNFQLVKIQHVQRLTMSSTRQRFILCLFLILLILPSVAFAKEKRNYPCYRMIKEPILDGRLRNDPAWKNIPAATSFVKFGTDFLALTQKQTFFKIGYNPDALYIGIECKEPEIEKIIAKLKDMGRLWTEDSIEVFIFPKGTDTYYQFIVNAIGSRWDISRQVRNWEAFTYTGKDFWVHYD